MLFGKIDQIGKDENAGQYKVMLEADGIVTGWLFLSKQTVKDNIEDYTLDKGTPVWVLMCDNMRTGIIGGAFNTSKYPVKESDPDTWQKYFKDGSYIKYDRKNHILTALIKDGDVNVECKNAVIKVSDTCKIEGKLTVTGEVQMDNKLTVTGDIQGNSDVKAGTVSLKNHVHLVNYVGDNGAALTTTSNPPTP